MTPHASVRLDQELGGRLAAISGPGGVGKGTVVARLRQQIPELAVSVSATTRAPRPGEIDGEHYHFMTDEEFQNLLNRDGFLEWERFGGYRYGTPWASIQESLDRGRTVLLEIDVGGALQVKRRDPTATLIFIAPPEVEALRHRLLKRGTDSPARIEERLDIAREELEAAAQFDHVVVNDELGAAVAAVARILGA